jgi:hypothetical protein
MERVLLTVVLQARGVGGQGTDSTDQIGATLRLQGEWRSNFNRWTGPPGGG